MVTPDKGCSLSLSLSPSVSLSLPPSLSPNKHILLLRLLWRCFFARKYLFASPVVFLKHTHTRTHARTHTRTHARTHEHTRTLRNPDVGVGYEWVGSTLFKRLQVCKFGIDASLSARACPQTSLHPLVIYWKCVCQSCSLRVQLQDLDLQQSCLLVWKQDQVDRKTRAYIISLARL